MQVDCSGSGGEDNKSNLIGSDFVTSVSCVLDAQKSPKTQNKSWHASCRTQRLVDLNMCFCRISCSCDLCGSY